MRNDISFFMTKLTVLALVAVLTGCGGGEGGGSDQNQSATQKPNNSDGGQNAKGPDTPKTAEKPAEKFTPEMVKEAWETALRQLSDLLTTEQLDEIRNKVSKPEELKLLVDEINGKIVNGKIDTPEMKVDAITVAALSKEIVATLKYRSLYFKSVNNAKQLTGILNLYAGDNSPDH